MPRETNVRKPNAYKKLKRVIKIAELKLASAAVFNLCFIGIMGFHNQIERLCGKTFALILAYGTMASLVVGLIVAATSMFSVYKAAMNFDKEERRETQWRYC